MNGGDGEHGAAIVELRRRLDDGLALAGLTKTQLAARAGLGRTTVQEAFGAQAPVPSAATIAALADALGLPEAPLLALRRSAAGTGVTRGDAGLLGKPIGDWDPHHLEVHPSGPGVGRTPVPVLSGYVAREHDRVLADAVRAAGSGRPQMVVLVGSSSTGKTRACWEAVQPLAERAWRLWHPFNPTRADAALEDLARVGPRTVVWLNEAQHYLGDARRGERIAAAVHELLTAADRGPILVLGTLWPEYARRYTASPAPGAPDPHSRVRELLAGRLVTVPDAFDARALQEAAVRAKAGDRLLSEALGRTQTSGRVAQDLAGAPLLLHRYLTASPGARALVEAAMDARRLGVGLHLPQDFLTAAAVDYLGQEDYDDLHNCPDWKRPALAELAEPVHGKQAPLRSTGPRPGRRAPAAGSDPAEADAGGPMLRLADYLEQYGRSARRRLCPPASFWDAAHAHLSDADDLDALARRARVRHRLQWAHHLRLRADLAAAGAAPTAPGPTAPVDDHPHEPQAVVVEQAPAAGVREVSGVQVPMALHVRGIWRAEAGDRAEAERLFRRAAEGGHLEALGDLALLREEAGDPHGAETLAREAAAAGHTEALRRLVELRECGGDHPTAQALACALADAGSPDPLCELAARRQEAGDTAAAGRLFRHAADAGHVRAVHLLALLVERAGDRTEAEVLARRAADGGAVEALFDLAVLRASTGDAARTESLFQQAADAGHAKATRALVVLWERAGRRAEAEALARRTARAGRPGALRDLAVLRARTGGLADAEPLFLAAVDAGHPDALRELVRWRDENGDGSGAEDLARQAVHTDLSTFHPLHELARWRDRNGVRSDSEPLYREAACLGDADALLDLAVSRERAGCHGDAEDLYREAADAGSVDALRVLWLRREERGDRRGADALCREAADAGQAPLFALDSRWPSGLDPDGTLTPQWNPGV
ncbi:hypothetical protein GCM10010302_31110 [Streptomyces polychromogenes]|uniref:HTH cro/C1-type domain-containing protein n=1 Tax=Streptomyces polychromogenes TaxID=67342 RepID=A0ABN0VE94_9ACTN